MLKLKFNLDPKDATQMLALSRFAGTLAGNAEIQVTAPALKEAEAPKVAAEAPKVAAEAPKVEAEAPKVEAEAPKVEAEAPKRKRRTRAEIEAEKAAQEESKEEDTDDESGEEVEGEDAGEEVEGEDAETENTPKAKASSITLDDVRQAVNDKREKHLAIMKFKLTNDFGVATVSKLDPKHYDAFYAYVNSL